MKIIGFGFKKISAEKGEPKGQKLEINSNIDIKGISKEKLTSITDEVLKIEFDFSVKYEPKVGGVSFLGYVLLAVDKSQEKDIIKKWKSKKVSDDIRIPLFNFILTKCNIRALQLEEEMNLPTHIPMPRISNKTQQDSNRTYVQ